MNHRYNLITLYPEYHNMVHQGKITDLKFIVTSKGIQLHYEN